MFSFFFLRMCQLCPVKRISLEQLLESTVRIFLEHSQGEEPEQSKSIRTVISRVRVFLTNYTLCVTRTEKSELILSGEAAPER